MDSLSHHVIIVEGARQVGKSFLVNDVLEGIGKQYSAFDLEKQSKLRHDISKTEDFYDFKALMTDRYDLAPNSILFIDEAQESPKLAEYIKSFKEDWSDIKVILTGSSMNRIYSDKVRIPVGRTKSICVFGFSFSEFIRYVKGDSLADFINSAPEKIPPSRHELLLRFYDDYISVGGYPEAVKAFKGGQSYREIMEEIIASLEEDFQRKESYQPGLFYNAMRAVANHIGSPSKLTHLDTTKYFAKQVLEAMKAWHIVLEVTPYALDPGRSDFLPKRYLHDIGVANMLRSLAVPQISLIDTIDPVLRTPLGGLFENAVLISMLNGDNAFKKISTWKKKKQSDIEIDFVIEAGDNKSKIPIECKATSRIKKQHYKNILHYLTATNQHFGVLVSTAPFQIIHPEENRTILNCPVYLAGRNNIIHYFNRFISLNR